MGNMFPYMVIKWQGLGGARGTCCVQRILGSFVWLCSLRSTLGMHKNACKMHASVARIPSLIVWPHGTVPRRQYARTSAVQAVQYEYHNIYSQPTCRPYRSGIVNRIYVYVAYTAHPFQPTGTYGRCIWRGIPITTSIPSYGGVWRKTKRRTYVYMYYNTVYSCTKKCTVRT
jgi:hypothetical protein